MLKRHEDMTQDNIENMRGGKGEVSILHILKNEEMLGKCRMFSKVRINPGASVGLHEHIKEEEIYYIIKGSGIVNDNGELKTIKAGDVLVTGNGESHSIECTSDEAIEMIAVVLVY